MAVYEEITRSVSKSGRAWRLLSGKREREGSGDEGVEVTYRSPTADVLDSLLGIADANGWSFMAADGIVYGDADSATRHERWMMLVDLWAYKAFGVLKARDAGAWQWFSDRGWWDGVRVARDWLWAILELLCVSQDMEETIESLVACCHFLTLFGLVSDDEAKEYFGME